MTYVCYRKDEVEFVGNRSEVLERYGKKWKNPEKTLTWYLSPSAKKRGNDCFCIYRWED